MTGLRESKKRQTRAAIAQAAADLFRDHGFAAVTVDDVAAAANVSRQTVFNYFPTKEQMLFDREEEIEAALRLALVRDQADGTPSSPPSAGTPADSGSDLPRPSPPGSSSTASGRSFAPARRSATTARRRSGAGGSARGRGRSPGHRGRPPDDPLCQGLARALCGVNVAVLTCGLERLTAGEDHGTVVSEMLAQADQAYDLLEHGVAGYTPSSAPV